MRLESSSRLQVWSSLTPEQRRSLLRSQRSPKPGLSFVERVQVALSLLQFSSTNQQCPRCRVAMR